NYVQSIVDNIPLWLMDGLRTAGGILPALGIAILLHYLPIKINIAYLLIGFFLVAFLNVPVLGVAIVGLALAIIEFQKPQVNNENNQSATVNGGVMGDE